MRFRDKLLVVGAVIFAIVAGLGIGLAMRKRAEIIYGDPNCAYANCVKVKVVH